jgi:two-component system, chemotaxis family, chemotaxis protein CheY
MIYLIVDDSEVARALIRTLLRDYDHGAVVLEAVDGREAVEIYTRENPDITILDLTMPVLNGYDALKIMKEKKPEGSVLVLTADKQDKAIARCLALGAAGVIRKNPTRDTLFPLLDGIIREKGL